MPKGSRGGISYGAADQHGKQARSTLEPDRGRRDAYECQQADNHCRWIKHLDNGIPMKSHDAIKGRRNHRDSQHCDDNAADLGWKKWTHVGEPAPDNDLNDTPDDRQRRDARWTGVLARLNGEHHRRGCRQRNDQLTT